MAEAAMRTGRRKWPLRYAAVAASLLVVAGGVLWWAVRRGSAPEILLARAYTLSRPFEYRLPDDGYGPVRQTRGANSTFERPESLALAEAGIRQRLAESADDPRALGLKGRAELLENDYEKAIESLTRASELKPDDPDLMADLGCAYAIRGDTERRNIDYGHAIDLFLKALKKKPSDERILFNLGIAYEKLWLVDEAAETWRKLLALTPPSGWAEEVRGHLGAMEKIQRDRKKAENDVVSDPRLFLAKVKSEADFDPDLYHEIFWKEWLPSAGSSTEASEAARMEARAFRRRFGDPSLEDTMAAAHGPAAAAAIDSLVTVIALNLAGRTDQAILAARASAAELDSANLRAGAMRARIELAYSYRRASMNRQCADLTEGVRREADTRSYFWLSGQARIVHAPCAERLAQSGLARAELAGARDDMERIGLHVPALRAIGSITGVDRMSGNYAPVWNDAPAGLKAYWTSNASPYRAQDFQYNLQASARALGWNDCAVVLFRAGIHSLERVGNAEMEALNRVYLAGLLESTGRYEEELHEFDAAERLFRSMTPGPAVDNLTWNALLGRAEAAVAAGHAGTAMSDLERLAAEVGSRSSLEQVRVEQALGLALAAAGDWHRAAGAFEKAIDWNLKKAASLRSYADRIPVLESAAASYRNLTQIRLREQHDPEGALQTWLLYQGISNSPGDAAVAASEGAARPLEVTYAVLPAGIAVWSRCGGPWNSRFVDAASRDVEPHPRDSWAFAAGRRRIRPG